MREISDLSKALGLFQLNETVFSLEVYLSSFVETDIVPAPGQIDALDGLVRALATAARLTPTKQVEPRAGLVTVFVLGEKGGLTTELGTALGKIDSDVHFFTDVETLLGRLGQHPPKIIVADTKMLPEMPPLSGELIRLRSHMSLHIPLLFISHSSALQLRVDAIRAGGDGYFVSPLDADAIAAQIRDLVLPEEAERKRVVVVEDDPTQAAFAGSILGKAGIEVLLITEPTQVIDRLREFRPDLILMDIYMPEVNGIELTSVIRDYPEFVATPIVFLSGEQNAEKQLQALSVGGDDFIAKPIRPKHLLTVVENRIRRSRQLQAAGGRRTPKRDRVTGLFSRQHFLDQVARILDMDDSDAIAAILAIRPDDLDRLRARLGVGGTDNLVAEMGSAVEAGLGDREIAARIGEHDFGVLLLRPSPEAVTDAARHLVDRIDTRLFPAHPELTVSGGLCLVDDNVKDANGAVNRALAACRAAAQAGGNRVESYRPREPAASAPVESDAELAERVKSAICSDSFIIQYQPLLDLGTRGTETYEVVVRLENAHGDLVGGRDLLAAAAMAGAGVELDQWILDRAIDILKQRRESGRRTRIFVHQSANTAFDPDMLAWLTGRLRNKRVVGTGLVIEFNLTELSQNLKAAQGNIRALKNLDIDVSLSRFPEKEAAFKILRFLQAGYIKIAPRLLKADRTVISSVIRLAHEAEAKVIVSNIDDPRSIDLHWSSGADYLQGNFIQRPLETMDYDFSQVVM